MAMINTRQATGPGKIKNIQIFSNTEANKSVYLTDLIIDNFKYYESLFQDVIHASVTYIDGGTAIRNKKGKLTTAVSGLPITGSERVELLFQDTNEEEIKVTLYVNNVTEIIVDSTKSMVTLSMNSIELYNNDKIRLNTRFDGKISEHIKKILEGGGETESFDCLINKEVNPPGEPKKVHIEETVGVYNKVFTNKKPFYIMNYLSTRAVPKGGQGNSGGFLLWETSKGFHFKSVDKLLNPRDNPVKRTIIFNETPGNPPTGYDIKALTFVKENRNDITSKFEQGAYATRLITFDPFTLNYEVSYPNAGNKSQLTGSAPKQKGDEDTLNKAAEELPKLCGDIKSAKGGQNDFSRTTFQVLDTGSIPQGKTISGVDQTQDRTGGNEQVEKSKNPEDAHNAKPAETLNQAIQRLNQINTMKISMTLPGDFTLHAGDAVRVDSPELSAARSSRTSQNVDDLSGGLYIIRDLCHYMTKDVTYTKINVIRDSFYRKQSD